MNNIIIKKIINLIKQRLLNKFKDTLGISDIEEELDNLVNDKNFQNNIMQIVNINTNNNSININSGFNMNEYIKLSEENEKLKNKISKIDKKNIYVSQYEFDKIKMLENNLYLDNQKKSLYCEPSFFMGEEFPCYCLTEDEIEEHIFNSKEEYCSFLQKKYLIPYNDSLSFQNWRKLIEKNINKHLDSTKLVNT